MVLQVRQHHQELLVLLDQVRHQGLLVLQQLQVHLVAQDYPLQVVVQRLQVQAEHQVVQV